MTIRYALGSCQMGVFLVAVTTNGICALLLGDTAGELKEDLRSRFKESPLMASEKDLSELLAKVSTFLDKPAGGLDYPLDPQGTPFQLSVWKALQDIPVGQTVTYINIAEILGMTGASRAVGSACGSNPVAVAIPCHRVVTSAGQLSGYRWGLARKRILLDLESTNLFSL